MVSNVFVCAVLHNSIVVAHCFTKFTKKSPKAKRIFGGACSSNMLVQETITIAPFPKNGMYAITIAIAIFTNRKLCSIFEGLTLLAL